jgi:hypothetical protein
MGLFGGAPISALAFKTSVDDLRALAQRVEVDAREVRIMGSKGALLRTLVAAPGGKSAGFGVPSFVPKWRAQGESNPCFRRERGITRPFANVCEHDDALKALINIP